MTGPLPASDVPLLRPLAVVIPSLGRPCLAACLRSLGPALEAARSWSLPGGPDPSHRRTEGDREPVTVFLVLDEGVDENQAWPPPAGDYELRVLRTPAGAGFATKANLGLAAAAAQRAELTLLLNDDVVVDADSVTQLLDAMWFAGATVGSPVLHPPGDRSRIQSAGIELDLARERVHLIEALPPDLPDDPAPWEVTAVPGTAMALRTDFVREIGGFDEEFSFYFEDVDLCLRLREVGHRVVICPTSRMEHEGAATVGRGPEQARLAQRGIQRLIQKHGQGPTRQRGRRALVRGLAQQIRQGPADLAQRLRAVWRGASE